MEAPRRIYENPSAGVEIFELETSFALTCPSKVNVVYSPYLSTKGGTVSSSSDDSSFTWTFDKTNLAAIQMVNQMTSQTIEKLFTYKPPSPGPINIRDAMARMAMAPPSAPAAAPSQYPRLIFDNQEYQLQVVDYSALSVVMFCTKEFGTTNNASITAAGGTFNFKLKSNADGSVKSPGWVFPKSRAEVKEFFKLMTGEDLIAKATPTTSKWNGNRQAPAAQPSSEQPSFGGPSMTAVSIPGIPARESGNPAAGLPAAPMMHAPPGGLPPTPPKAVTSACLLNQLLDMMTLPMVGVQRKELPDPNGWTRVGLYGVAKEVDAAVAEFRSECGYMEATFSLDIEISRSGNKTAIVSRIPPSA